MKHKCSCDYTVAPCQSVCPSHLDIALKCLDVTYFTTWLPCHSILLAPNMITKPRESSPKLRHHILTECRKFVISHKYLTVS